jgi:hypothetical protein
MKEGLIDKIKSRGYWRINLQPNTMKIRLDNLSNCESIVERNSVNLRGWDFPHIPKGKEEHGIINRYQSFVESWSDWSGYKEFWRMYKDGQFLCYRGLREDWFEEHLYHSEWASTFKPKEYLGVLYSVIYEVTEFYVFSSRLSQEGLYDDGLVINIHLKNIFDRQLWLEDNHRIAFLFNKKTSAPELLFSKTYNQNDMIEKYQYFAREIISDVFDSFGWNPSHDIIISEQEKLLNRKLL